MQKNNPMAPMRVTIACDGVTVADVAQRDLFKKNGHRASPEILEKLREFKEEREAKPRSRL